MSLEGVNISEDFVSVLDRLEAQQFLRDNNIALEPPIQIDNQELKRAGWYASIYASSKNESVKAVAQKFAALILYSYPDNSSAVKLSYVIFSRLGNLYASVYHDLLYEENQIDLVERRFKSSFGALLDYEIARKRDLNQIKSIDGSYLATDFQIDLWRQLKTSENVSISAPTSSGKSFIVQKYVKECFKENNKFKVLYIVPTRALISQVSDEFRKELGKEVDIKTSYVEREPIKGVVYEANQEVYVVTPERSIKLLELGYQKEFTPNVVFIDEIQNIENNDSRGVLLENVLRQCKSIWPLSKYITAGPYITNGDVLFEKIFDAKSRSAETTLSPVSQIRTIVSVNNDGTLDLVTNTKESFKVRLKTEENLAKKFDASIGQGIAKLLQVLGVNGPSLVYCPQTNWAESRALECIKEFEKNGTQTLNDPEIEQFSEFLSKEIHEEYFLKRCIQYGVAFHHSKLPEVVRREVESLFISKKLKLLFCTSTLLQGVNLPALNMFIDVPKKKDIDMSTFEFGNLIGRAGRFSESLYGTIYAIRRDRFDSEKNLKEDWTKKYMNEEFSKEVTPATENIIEDHIDTVIAEIGNPVNQINREDKKVEDTLIYLRHKFIESQVGARELLLKRKASEEQISRILNGLSVSLGESILPFTLLRKNPSIDPLIQNAIAAAVDEEGVESWLVHSGNGGLFDRLRREDAEQLAITNRPLFYQLEAIMTRLDDITSFRTEAFFKNQIGMSISQMVLYGVQWLGNLSLREIISNDIAFFADHDNPEKRIDPKNPRDINKRINENIKISGTVVTFVLAKYLKLLNDILTTRMNEHQLEQFKFSLSLPMMLELGTRESVVIELISKGIPRAIAISIFKIIPEEQHDDPYGWLIRQSDLKIHPIYKKYLIRVGVLSIKD